LWVRQGRTDAWIAHKLDITVEQLEQFKRDHRVNGEPAPPAPEPFETAEVSADDRGPEGEEVEPEAEAEELDRTEEEEVEPQATESAPGRRRRRGRRGGRRQEAKGSASFEGTFEHGEEGYGLWLDPSVADDEVYAEHWAGHRQVAVTVESDAITIRRVEDGGSSDA
jgi:hypothetical protein